MCSSEIDEFFELVGGSVQLTKICGHFFRYPKGFENAKAKGWHCPAISTVDPAILSEPCSACNRGLIRCDCDRSTQQFDDAEDYVEFCVTGVGCRHE